MTVSNKLTLLRIFLVPVFIAAFYWRFSQYWNFIAAAIFIIAAITDMLDGQLARKYNQVTDFGKLMDPIADKLLTTSALILLVEWGRFPAVIAIIIIGREFWISGIRMIAATNNVVIAASWLGKLKTITQIVAICAVLLENVGFREIGVPFDSIMIYVALIFTVWSGIDYSVKNKKCFSAK